MTLPKLASAPTAELKESIRHHSRKKRALQDEMWESREILTLDAASAHPGLVVSPDRHSMWHGNSRGCLPSDHRRFFPASCILGSEGFSSGRHRWEVEVGDKDGWEWRGSGEGVREEEGPHGAAAPARGLGCGAGMVPAPSPVSMATSGSPEPKAPQDPGLSGLRRGTGVVLRCREPESTVHFHGLLHRDTLPLLLALGPQCPHHAMPLRETESPPCQDHGLIAR
ncbi:E3 ubiquitin-protein ligase TRIM7-like [Gopherus evgoodei]|uniref:E3 ubiquitin-protein ligase TRIM7-like n=1 Tax=Gopherus evgoodei TaxID=1825980 RepID=UPI0011CF7F6E|nr:E3 ubiquitin-protein ligase TRIM7-like [Gopherus evgoodei]